MVVNYGASQTFTMTPNAGAVVYDVIVDGVSQGARASFTFSNVTANHTISAAFISEAGLVAWYPFDGNALDYSGSLNHGIVNGATPTADRFGNPDTAYNFNGTSNWIQVATHNNIPSGSSPYTVTMWASVTDYSVDQGGGMELRYFFAWTWIHPQSSRYRPLQKWTSLPESLHPGQR